MDNIQSSPLSQSIATQTEISSGQSADTLEYGGPSDDPLLQAMYRVVHRYPGGIDSLAKQINRTSKYLVKAVSGMPGAKLNIEDAQAITQITGDIEMLEVMANELGQKLIKLPPPTTESDEFTPHAENAMKQLGLCISFSAALGSSPLLQVSAAKDVCSFIQVAMPHNNAVSISPNEFRKLSSAYLLIDRNAFAGSPFHLQMHADLLAGFVVLQRKVPNYSN